MARGMAVSLSSKSFLRPFDQVFVSSCRALRIGTTLALNICPPFHSISNAVRPFSILPSARTVIEDEIRRNTFWLMYAIERQHGSGNGWPLCLDDEDVSQLLPVRGDLFEQGVCHNQILFAS